MKRAQTYHPPREQPLHAEGTAGRKKRPAIVDDPLIGAVLGEYQVLERIGEGGMGIVYRGLQPLSLHAGGRARAKRSAWKSGRRTGGVRSAHEREERLTADRGAPLGLADQARFQLEVERDAPKALELAARNWVVRKEPADARVLLEAALAAKKPEAAREAARFVVDTKAEEPRLIALAKRVLDELTRPRWTERESRLRPRGREP